MRHLLAVGIFALTTGMAMAIPAHADDDYIKDGYSYRYDDDYVPYQRAGMLTQYGMIRDLERQGYYGVSDLHPNSFSIDWEAVAYINGTMVRVTLDPYTGRVLYVNTI